MHDAGTAMRRLAAQGELAGFEVPERFYEIGSPEGLAELERLLSRNSATQPQMDADKHRC